MNLHPKIAGTLFLYQFQGNMHDSSDNGLDLSLVGGTERYESIATCLSGFTFDGATWMRSAVSSVAQYTGSHTIEFLVVQRQSFSQVFFKTDTHDTPGSVANMLWQYYIDAGNHYSFASQNGVSYIGSPGPVISCLPYVVGGTSNHTVYHFAFRKTVTGPSNYTVDCLINGVLQGSTLFTGTLTPNANQCLWVGGSDFLAFDNVFEGAMASLRIVNYARTNAQILADANFALGVCGTVPTYPVSDTGIGASGVNFDPDDRRDAAILRGKVGLSMQTGFKERLPDNSTSIAAFRNMTAAAQAGTVFRQRPKMFPMPDDGR